MYFHMEMLKTMKTKWADAWGFIQCAGAVHSLQLQSLTSTSQSGRGGCHCPPQDMGTKASETMPWNLSVYTLPQPCFHTGPQPFALPAMAVG